MPVKIAFTGAGSIGFTRKLLSDLLTVPELQDSRIFFHDIDEQNLEMVRKLCQRDIAANELDLRIETTTDRTEAFHDASYVVNTIRVGGLEAFRQDIEIPLEYGVDQCVGDTLGPGGLMYAQRGVPVILDICRDIREYARSNCLLLNYSNPMAMLTWACLKYGGVRAVGLCHGVQGGHHMIKNVIERLWNRDNACAPSDDGYLKLHVSDVDIICAGINHQTWYLKALFKGEDWTSRLLEGFEQHEEYSKTEKVRIDMLRRFGYFSTESNGHLSEYVGWYRKRPHEVPEWIDMSTWINGETGGYLRVCKEGRESFMNDYDEWLAKPPMQYSAGNRSEEHGSYIIESLETGRIYRGHFNVQNNGIIPNLPEDCIIEAPGYVDRNGLSVPLVGDLPLGCAAVCNQSVSVQRMGMEAAVNGDLELLKQAMLLDPLTAAVCNPPEVWQMTDRMVDALAHWLPQYQTRLPEIRGRLKDSEDLRRHQDYKGAARSR